MADTRSTITRRGLLGRAGLGVFAAALMAGGGLGMRHLFGKWILGWGRPRPPPWRMPLERPILGAHRGGAGIFPEHTLAAFAGAHDQFGCRFLELDVRLTADGVPVIIHDATVDRTTDKTGRVADFRLPALQSLDAGYRFRGPDGVSWAHRGLRIPALASVLARFPDSVCSIEIKEPEPVAEAAVVAAVRANGAAGRVLLGAFDDAAVARLQALAPEMPTFYSFRAGLLLLTAHWSGLSRWYRPIHNALLIPRALFGRHYINGDIVAMAQAHGLPVLVWTVDEMQEMHDLLDLGVDGIITDRPDRLAAVIRTRTAAHEPRGREVSRRRSV
jgi:glycerophosphoryl diester phosphodiesterase